ncbi:hypothetical protein [Paenibacillus sp. N3.4]|nr:hypothetical protein [Paenibacillus sp. N3.4]
MGILTQREMYVPSMEIVKVGRFIGTFSEMGTVLRSALSDFRLVV